MAKLITAGIKYVKQKNKLFCQEAKPIIAILKYINSKMKKYFQAIPKSCLVNEFID